MKKTSFIQLNIIAFFVGIIAAEFIPFLWLAIVSIFSFFIMLGVSKYQKHKDNKFIYFIVFFIAGAIRFIITIPTEHNHIANWAKNNLSVEVEGRIVMDPQASVDQQSFTMEARSLTYKNDTVTVKGKIAAKTQRYPVYHYDDQVKLIGKLSTPSSEGTFSYEDYLAKEDTWGVMNRVRIIVIHSSAIRDGPMEYFWKGIYGLKHFLQERIEILFPAPDASIVLGLLLGLRATIPASILTDFQRTGLTHILAISGYNITLLINIANLCFGNMERTKRIVLTIGMITFFSIITGLSASVIRAALMGILVVIAIAFGRKTQGMHLLLMSAFLMALQNPRILLWDVSFQLSFLSTMGILVLMPLCEQWFEKLPPLLQESIPVTLSATIFTSPIILYYFGSFSFISLITNMVFLPLVPLCMIASSSALVISYVFMPLAWIIAAINWLLMRLLVDGVHIFASLPFAAIIIPPIPLWSVGIMYGLIIITIVSLRKKRLKALSS